MQFREPEGPSIFIEFGRLWIFSQVGGLARLAGNSGSGVAYYGSHSKLEGGSEDGGWSRRASVPPQFQTPAQFLKTSGPHGL